MKSTMICCLVAVFVMFGLCTSANAVSYDPNTTIVVYLHGFSPSGYNRVGVYGDDTSDSRVFDDVQHFAQLMNLPTWQDNPTAPNQVVGCTYYGDTAPSWYTAQDVADDAAASGQVPRYALRVAKYIQHVLQRAPSATAVNVVSGSFGTLVARYMIEHDLLGLASTKISRWNTVVGVTTGNWAATNVPDWLAQALGANSPDIDDMKYSWVDANISARTTMNTALYGPMIITHWIATADGSGYVTTATGDNYANDGTNLCRDEYFWGYTTSSALHAAADGVLQLPAFNHQPVEHSDIADNAAMWAGVAAASQNNKRVTVTMSRIKALSSGDSWIQGKGEWVFSFSAVSPMAATLYGCTVPYQNFKYSDGVSPLLSLGKNETQNPNVAFFDQIVPPGETQLNISFEAFELDWFYSFYKVTENPWGDNKSMGVLNVTVSTLNNSTITVSNNYMEVDFTITIRYVY